VRDKESQETPDEQVFGSQSSNDWIDQRIASVLASRPAVPIPFGFAVRVARAAAAQPLPRTPRLRLPWGLSAALLSAVFLMVAMIWLASATHIEVRLGALSVVFQTIYLAEFALAIWGALRFHRLLR
jgi:hypothetical protein